MRELGFAAAQTLYLFAPVFVSAALFGVVLRWRLLRALDRPIDGGATVRGRRLFGATKTWRAPAVAFVVGAAAVAAQKYLIGARAGGLAIVDYAHVSAIGLGAAIGGGSVVGELPNSFLKRQLDIPPSGTARGWARPVFYFLDQVDFLILTWPMMALFIRPRALYVGLSFALALALHPLVALLGYLVGARRSAR